MASRIVVRLYGNPNLPHSDVRHNATSESFVAVQAALTSIQMRSYWKIHFGNKR